MAEISALKILERSSIPDKFELFSLQTRDFQDKLKSTQAENRGTSTIISLPIGDGTVQQFKVIEAAIFAPGLQAKYPDIRSYTAKGIDDPTATARISISPYTGVNVMISSGKHPTVYIDPYTRDHSYYIVYNRAHYHRKDDWSCLVKTNPGITHAINNSITENDSVLRTYRLALACTGEYSQYHLNRLGINADAPDSIKKAAVLSEMNVAMTRVNGIYERDLSVRMILIENNDKLIFLDKNADSYSNEDGFSMLGQNQDVCDNIIGDENYDIGHVFSTGGGGVAYLDAPCVEGTKAKGVTGLYDPIGDPFYVDYVAHEMGHQFGANHTFNGDHGSCEGNRNDETAMEPGSASTIMGYAGICDDQDIQANSDAYFHAISIQEIRANITDGQALCSVNIPTSNRYPVVDAGFDYNIPKSTPFILHGSAIDINGDSLTYCWEQMDPEIGTQPPTNKNSAGPVFRSINPSNSALRYFPRISTVIEGNTEWEWEVVPSVGRTLNFRLTARDNAPGGGGTGSDNMHVKIISSAGPFQVTSQNVPVTWGIQNNEIVTWDVANSDKSPVNCGVVDILFSYDGGYTYPDTLAQAVPNTGSAVITAPNQLTSTGRVMVKAKTNIFYDINNVNITVAPLCNGVPIAGSVPDSLTGCPGQPLVLASTGTTSDVGGIELQWQSEQKNDTAWSDIDGANTTIVTIMGVADTTYYRMRVICSATQDTVYTDTIVYTPKSYKDCYCLASIDLNVEPITLVDFAGIHNPSSSGVNESPGFEDFRNIQGTVEQGRHYPITVQGNTDGPNISRIAAYFDWNQNGVFEENTEKYLLDFLYASDGTDGKQSTGTILVPKEAQIGITRMRVVKKINNRNPISPCGLLDKGQVEDYSLEVKETNCDSVSAHPLGNTPCSGDTLFLTAKGEGSFQWKGAGGLTSNEQNPVFPDVLSENAGIFTVEFLEYSGCSVTDSVEVTVIPGVTAQLGEIDRDEEGCNVVVNIGNGVGPFTYLWSNGETDSLATNIPKGDFAVTVTAANGCKTVLNGACYSLANHSEILSKNIAWPNPTKDYVTFDRNNIDLNKIQPIITDLLGRNVSQVKIDSKQNRINLTNLKPGIYLIHFTTNSDFKTIIKVVKI